MVLMLGVNGVMGQTSIISNVAGGGTLPTNWTSNNGNTANVILTIADGLSKDALVVDKEIVFTSTVIQILNIIK